MSEKETVVADINEIMRILPHRYPFLLVDKLVEFSETGGTTIKNFTINEEFFKGHFPNNPVVPAVLLIECMAQSAAIIAIKVLEKKGDNKPKAVLFTGIDSAKFRKPVVPGDVYKVKVKLTKTKMRLLFAEIEGFVDDVKVNECKISALLYDRDSQK